MSINDLIFQHLWSIRELVPPSEMVPSDARQVHMGPHLGPPLPPHANVLPGRAFPGAGECDWSDSTGSSSHQIFYPFSISLCCYWALTASLCFLPTSWLRLPSLWTHGNGCSAAGTDSQAKHCQVECAHVSPTRCNVSSTSHISATPKHCVGQTVTCTFNTLWHNTEHDKESCLEGKWIHSNSKHTW